MLSVLGKQDSEYTKSSSLECSNGIKGEIETPLISIELNMIVTF